MTTITLHLPGGTPDLAQIQGRFGLKADEIDHVFGVIGVDPQRSLYAIRVDELAAHRILGNFPDNAKGPYSDPKIEPFGPPQ